MSGSRITTEPSFLDLVDKMSRGGTAEWRELYRRAQRDSRLREEIRAALEFVDPELGASRELWSFLLSRLDHDTTAGGARRRMAS